MTKKLITSKTAKYMGIKGSPTSKQQKGIDYAEKSLLGLSIAFSSFNSVLTWWARYNKTQFPDKAKAANELSGKMERFFNEKELEGLIDEYKNLLSNLPNNYDN